MRKSRRRGDKRKDMRKQGRREVKRRELALYFLFHLFCSFLPFASFHVFNFCSNSLFDPDPSASFFLFLFL